MRSTQVKSLLESLRTWEPLLLQLQRDEQVLPELREPEPQLQLTVKPVLLSHLQGRKDAVRLPPLGKDPEVGQHHEFAWSSPVGWRHGWVLKYLLVVCPQPRHERLLQDTYEPLKKSPPGTWVPDCLAVLQQQLAEPVRLLAVHHQYKKLYPSF